MTPRARYGSLEASSATGSSISSFMSRICRCFRARPLRSASVSGTRLGTVIVEGALFVLAVAWYSVRTKPISAVGRWALWGLVTLLAVVYVANLVGPPPNSEQAVGYSALLLWLLVPWAYWIDRHRVSSGSS